MFERTYIKQAQRTDSSIITGKDIETAFADPDIAAMLESSSKKIGFAA